MGVLKPENAKTLDSRLHGVPHALFRGAHGGAQPCSLRGEDRGNRGSSMLGMRVPRRSSTPSGHKRATKSWHMRLPKLNQNKRTTKKEEQKEDKEKKSNKT